VRTQELKDRLKITGGQVRIEADSLDDAFRAQVLTPFYPSKSIEIRGAHLGEGASDHKVVIRGNALCPLLPADKVTDVMASFELKEEELTATLRYALPPNWKFSDSFPDLPLDLQGEKAVLDDLLLTDSYFYLTSRAHTHKDDRIDAQLQSGLNFIGRWKPDGVLALLKDLLASGDKRPAGEPILLLQGPIVLPSAEGPPSLASDQFPWDSTRSFPGVYLQANLGFELNLPPQDGKIKFTNLRVQIYTPTSWSQLYREPSCGTVMAYLGDIIIPSIRAEKLATLTGRIWLDSDDQLVLACKFNQITLQHLSTALANMTGITDLLSVIPADVGKVIGGLGPRSASIHLIRADGKYRVACTDFTIGIEPGSEPWAPFDWLKVQFESLRIAVANPFDEEQRSTFATIKGQTKVFGVGLSVAAEVPGFFISAEQIGDKKVDLGRCFEELGLKGLPPPPKFDIKRLSLVIQPPDSYTFSMVIDPEKSWEIEAKDHKDVKYSLPHVRLSLSNQGWEFEAGTDEGQPGVPVAALIYKLAQEGGLLGDSLPNAVPPALSAFTVDHLSLSYDSNSQRFAFVCDGSFRPDRAGDGHLETVPALRARVSIDKNSERGSATFLVGVAAQGLSLDKLIRLIAPDDLAAYVPEDFSLELRDVLFAFVTGTQSRCLFALDFGVDINLADTVSHLEFLKTVGISVGRVGFEDLQILIASEAFSRDDVGELNSLLPTGFRTIPDVSQQSKRSTADAETGKTTAAEALQKGFNFAAKLRLPDSVKPLSLPADLKSDKRAEASTPQASLAPATKWFDIQKSLGPLYLGRVGFQYRSEKKTVNFLLDSSIDLMSLRVGLLGLRVGAPMATLAKFAHPGPDLLAKLYKEIEFGLDGLELAIKQKPLEISGTLLKVYPTDPEVSLQYDGRVLVRADVFTLAALGSYAVVKDQPSLFIFAVLHKELGGPDFFFVTGLAFGFGVNRLLRLPAIGEVHHFPLIKGATDPQYFGSDATPRTALEKLQEYIPPSSGDYWLAAGVKFSSYGMIDSFAVLSVSFGTQFQIAILGLSKITVPRQLPGADRVDPVACAELAIKVTFTLASGLLAAEARLTDNSFVFSKDCRLTGGFALYCWFGPEHAGDFVVTLGGYHPKFVPPQHYPVVPRLGMNWAVGQDLALSGELYFALTPSCLMAGGKLAAVYQAGRLRAWFYARADFLIAWQPFYYDIAMEVRIGVAYLFSLEDTSRALSIELGAALQMWGPPFGGTAHVTWFIISFDVAFGAPQQERLEKAEWKAFQQSFLPQADEPGADPLVGTIRITSGLIKVQEVTRDSKKSTRSVVNAHELSFTTESVLPATSVLLNDKPVQAVGLAPKPVGIRPMDIKELESKHAVRFEPLERSQRDWDAYLAPTLITRNVPEALWSNKGLTRLERPAAEMIEKVPNGVRVALRHRDPSHGLAPIELKKFEYELIPKDIDWQEWQPPVPIPAPGDKTLENTIWGNPTVDATRNAILTALGKDPAQVDLRNLASASAEIFQSEPDMARPGEPFKQPLFAA
jgi:hypothetical protein